MKIRNVSARTMLLASGAAVVALAGGACAADDGSVSPGQEAPAEDPFAPADDAGTTAGDTGEYGTTGESGDFGTTGADAGTTTGAN